MQTVTLWLGNFQSAEDLKKYLYVGYTDDGDSIDSNFEKDFHLGFYDRDLIESDWIENKEVALSVLLEGFSYDNQIIQQFLETGREYNTIILIYDYSYDKRILRKEKDDFFLELIGTASYEV